MPKIIIKKISEGEADWVFEVTVKDDDTSTNHEVRLTKDFYEKIESDSSPEVVVRKSFEFLLEREPKESILGKFELSDITKYFSKYDDHVKKF